MINPNPKVLSVFFLSLALTPNFQLKFSNFLAAPLVGSSGSLDFPVVQSKAVISPLHRWRAISVKPVNAELLAVSLHDALGNLSHNFCANSPCLTREGVLMGNG